MVYRVVLADVWILIFSLIIINFKTREPFRTSSGIWQAINDWCLRNFAMISFYLQEKSKLLMNHESCPVKRMGFWIGQTWFHTWLLLFISSGTLNKLSLRPGQGLLVARKRNAMNPGQVKKGIMVGLQGISWEWRAESRSDVQSVPWAVGSPACGGTEILAVLHEGWKRSLYLILFKA